MQRRCHAPLASRFIEEKFDPRRRSVVFAAGHVIVSNRVRMRVASLEKPALDVWPELANGDLDVDDVLGAETRNGRRADMIDASGEDA